MTEKNSQAAESDIEPVNEESFTDTELVEEETQYQDKLKKLREELKQCDTEKKKHLEDLQRAKADFLNAKKRLESEKSLIKDNTINELIRSLLPLCDSFHVARSDDALWQSTDSKWRSGVEAIEAQLKNVLKTYGVTAIASENEIFDPEHHEAVQTIPVEDKAQDGVVIAVVQPGYQRTVADTNTVIRPARVSVGEYTQK